MSCLHPRFSPLPWPVVARSLLAAGVVLSASVARAELREPLDLVPAESLLCWAGRPLPDTAPADGEPSALQTLLELGTRIAGSTPVALDATTRLGLRMAEMANLAIRYPHALALIDARARPLEHDPAARRVDRLKVALIVQNRGQVEPFLRIIQKAVNEQTDAGAATLVSRQSGRWSYQELRDQRLPRWSAIAWGHIGDYFVLTVGDDVWPDVAGVADGDLPAITYDPWFAVARGQRRAQALIEIFVQAEEMQRRLDPFVYGRATEFFDAWDAGGLLQAHWCFGFEGRALFCLAHYRIGDQTHRRLYADPGASDQSLLAAVPPEAHYAVFEFPMERFVRRFFAGLLATQDEKLRVNIAQIWRQMQVEGGFDAERDILAHLGERVVVHNDPPHPLRLPLALTSLTEIRDEPAAVQRAMDALCAGWRDALEEAAARAGRQPDFTVHHDEDGVWYIRVGPLAGVAWTVTDRFIITSWSPRALREYLAKLGAAARADGG